MSARLDRDLKIGRLAGDRSCEIFVQPQRAGNTAVLAMMAAHFSWKLAWCEKAKEVQSQLVW